MWPWMWGLPDISRSAVAELHLSMPSVASAVCQLLHPSADSRQRLETPQLHRVYSAHGSLEGLAGVPAAVGHDYECCSSELFFLVFYSIYVPLQFLIVTLNQSIINHFCHHLLKIRNLFHKHVSSHYVLSFRILCTSVNSIYCQCNHNYGDFFTEPIYSFIHLNE